MRKPAPSILALIAPVRLRLVASGLMMESVRSLAIVVSLNPSKKRPPYSGGLMVLQVREGARVGST